MATSMVPMFGPDGSLASIPSDKAAAAMASGGKLAVHIYSPDGTPSYIPHDQLGPALAAGGTYSPASASSQGEPKGFVQSLLNSSPAGAVRGLANSFTQGPQNPTEAAIKGTTPDSGIVARTLGQIGLGGYRNLIAPSIENGRAAIQDAQSPNLSDRLASGSEALAAIPIVGQGINAGRGVLQQYLSGDTSGAIGSAIGNVGTAGIAAAIGGKMGETQPTNITPQYAAARSIAKAVLPKEAEFNSYVDALQREKGNVEQYAAQNGLTTRTPLNMSVAAGKSADALGDFYRNNILGPNADQQVSVPARFDQLGSQAPSGSRYATLGDVDKRIGELNDIIRPARLNATQGATATDLNNLQDVVNEHDALVNILHNKLGAATNLDPSVIAGVRQSLGARNQLADQTLAGANRTSLQEGRIDRGVSTVKTPSVGGLVLDAINKLRGGPEAIANRVYRNAYPKLDVPSNIGNPASLDELRGSSIADLLSGKR